MSIVTCPKCGGRMWDNRQTKKNPKAPDYKCQNRSCDGVIWPPKVQSPTPITPVQPDNTKPTMRAAYRSLTEWVLSDIAQVYADSEMEFSSEVAAACVQTLFIQACNAGKVE